MPEERCFGKTKEVYWRSRIIQAMDEAMEKLQKYFKLSDDEACTISLGFLKYSVSSSKLFEYVHFPRFGKPKIKKQLIGNRLYSRLRALWQKNERRRTLAGRASNYRQTTEDPWPEKETIEMARTLLFLIRSKSEQAYAYFNAHIVGGRPLNEVAKSLGSTINARKLKKEAIAALKLLESDKTFRQIKESLKN